MFKSFRQSCLLLAIFLLLIACSPKLNWRIVQAPEQRYAALFPGKPDKLERKISIGDQQFVQTLEAVKLDDDIYSISSIEIPAKDNKGDLVQKITAQLQNNLLDRAKASGGSVVDEAAYFQNSQRQRLQTNDYYIFFGGDVKAKQIMRVRWITRANADGGVWIYQVSCLLYTSDAADD